MINSIHLLVEQFLQHKRAILQSLQSRFEKNGAIIYYIYIGGAIFAYGCRLKIFNSRFLNNWATVANNGAVKTNYCSDSDNTITSFNGINLLVTNTCSTVL